MATSSKKDSSECSSSAPCCENVVAEDGLTRHYEMASTTILDKFISSIKFSLFKEKYPKIFEENPENLKDLYDQMCSQLRSGIRADIAELEEKMNVDSSLSSLNKEIMKHKNKNVRKWRPSGDPAKDFRAHAFVMKSNYRTELQEKLQTLQLENDELRNVMAMEHSEIMRIKKENDDLHQKFSEIADNIELNEEFSKLEADLLELKNECHSKK